MAVYYCIFIFLTALSFIDLKKIERIHRTALIFIVGCILILLAGLRCDNADWDSYSQIFINITKGNFFASSDIGFNLFLWLISLVTKQPVIMFIIIASVSVSLNIKSYNKYTKYIFVCILVYFVHNYALKEMIQIRVGMASAICLYSMRYIYEKKYKQFLFIWTFAITIHFTALIFCLVYFAVRAEFSKKILLKVLVFSVIVGSIYPLGSVLKNLLGINDRLDAYIAYGDSGYAQSLGIWTNMNAIKCLMIFFALYHYYDAISKTQPYFKTLFYSYSVGICWLICFNDFAIIGARMSNILLSVEPILLTSPLYIIKNNSKYIYIVGLVILAYVMFNLNVDPNKIIPYNFYLSRYTL